jgi:hypothetical protein
MTASGQTIREQLVSEIAQAPDALVAELLDFYLFINQRSENPNLSDSGLLEFLSEVQGIQAEVPVQEWDKLPHDGSINHDHYLYDAP